jgi:hypothetical protein
MHFASETIINKEGTIWGAERELWRILVDIFWSVIDVIVWIWSILLHEWWRVTRDQCLRKHWSRASRRDLGNHGGLLDWSDLTRQIIENEHSSLACDAESFGSLHLTWKEIFNWASKYPTIYLNKFCSYFSERQDEELKCSLVTNRDYNDERWSRLRSQVFCIRCYHSSRGFFILLAERASLAPLQQMSYASKLVPFSRNFWGASSVRRVSRHRLSSLCFRSPITGLKIEVQKLQTRLGRIIS